MGQRWNLVAAFAERRHGEWDDVEAIEQVLPEPSLLHELLEVGVGCGDDANVDREWVRISERRKSRLIQETATAYACGQSSWP